MTYRSPGSNVPDLSAGSPASATSTATPLLHPVTETVQAASKIRLRLAAAVVALWGAIVAVMWLTTANPVALSTPQIERSDVIVTGQRPDHQSQRLQVSKVWRGELPNGEHTILNLGRLKVADMPPGVDFFVPLSQVRSGWIITTLPAQSPEKPPLVYPVTPATTQALQDLLARPSHPAPR